MVYIYYSYTDNWNIKSYLYPYPHGYSNIVYPHSIFLNTNQILSTPVSPLSLPLKKREIRCVYVI